MPFRTARPPRRDAAARAWAARATTILALAAGPARARAQAAACAPVPLRDALERLAAQAGIRLSYSRELIAVDRPVCAPAAGVPVLAALDSLLRGTGVEAVSVGGGQIVLTPSTQAGGATTGQASRPAVLDRVVVTGSAAGAPSRSLPVALSVVDGTALGPNAATSLATALDGVVPGLWLWAQPTTTLLSRYAGMRGASSFGLTTPKLYLDGVEVANPLFVTSLTSDEIARVEVIRGPQGAALYGADAISGVINVVTRHDGAEGGRAFTVRSGVGAAATAFAARPALAQDYGFSVRTGAGSQTAGLSVGFNALGPVVPGSTAYQVAVLADTRRVTPAGVLTLTARFTDAVAPPTDTSGLAAFARPATSLPLATQHVSELTLAANGVRATGGRWTQTFTAGLDGYHLAGVSALDMAAIPQPLDSTQGTARGTAVRGTLRASTTATYDLARGLAATVTGIADYGLLRDATQFDTLAGANRSPNPYTSRADMTGTTWLGTGGLVAQSTLAWRDAVFVTAGLRGERNDGFTDSDRMALLPSLGVSAVRTLGGATLKLRTAYGSGLRPVRSAARQVACHAFGGCEFGESLSPESQTGVEGGADLFLGSASPGDAGAGASLALHLTGFDQQASNLVQQVATPPAIAGGPRPGGWERFDEEAHEHGSRRFDYLLQNVGAISNRGFEGESQLRVPGIGRGVLTVGATLTYVDSRVRRTAAGYTGDLRAGDRVLEVPRWTTGVTAGWRVAGWSTLVGVARAADWINYDRLKLADATAASTTARPDASFTGQNLRAFWRRHPGVTRVRAEVSHNLLRGLSAVFTGENLLNYQQGEPDDVTKLPGRTLTAGFRATF